MSTPRKRIYVILAFHDHRPIPDLAHRSLAAIGEAELSAGTTAEEDASWCESDAESIYQKLIQFSRTAKIPVTLSITNETLFQIRKFLPLTYEALKEAYKKKEIFPLYTFAHHTHVVLIHPDEIIDEIKLNREFLHYLMGVPHPRFRGVFPTEASLDEDKLIGISEAKISFIIFPQLDPRRANYRVEGDGDVKTLPFWVSHGLLALPRHLAVSQGIIKSLMLGNPERAVSMGYLLGDLPVFQEEYLGAQRLSSPINRDYMIRSYTEVLRAALEDAPDRGLLLYMQELNPMCLGAQALDILQESWKAVKVEGVELSFVTPDEYLAEIRPKDIPLRSVSFSQVSWLPETRLVLRVDGHYPPLGVERWEEVNVSRQIYLRWPLIFWQPGCFMVELVEVVYETLGISFDIDTTASKLADEDYDLSRFEPPLQLAMHLRFIKGARNWGPRPDEAVQKRPYMHLLCICSKIRKRYEDVLPLPVRPLPGSVEGMIKSLDILIQGRVNILGEAVRTTAQGNPKDIEAHLSRAEEGAREGAGVLGQMLKRGEDQLTVGELIEAVGSHSRLVIQSLGDLERAWKQCSDAGAMRDFYYRYLYKTFPPKFPEILVELGRDYKGVR